MRDRILGEQPAEQGLYRVGAPIAIRWNAFGDFLGGERAFVPQHFHHGMFGFADTFGHATRLLG